MTEKIYSVMLFCIETCQKPFYRIFKLHVALLIKKIRDDHLMVYLISAMLTSMLIFSILWSVPSLKLFPYENYSYYLKHIYTYRCVYLTTC